MRTIPIFLALAIVGPMLGGASECEVTTHAPELDTKETPAGRYYAMMDGCCGGGGSVWIYEESNGLDGLQRNDEWVDDTCGGAIDSDTIVF